MDTLIQGRYALSAPVGAGGMGVVYRAVDTRSGDPVAVKRLKSELVSPDLIARFAREGEALRRLNHPNIVHIIETVQQDGDHYLVMEYIPGGDLNAFLKAGRPPLRRTLSIALDIADALTRAHRIGIVHRDLKPANILLAADGTPRLTDFGVAYVADAERVTASGVAVGTLDYLAPEAFAGDPAAPSTDIWSFGVLLWEMLTGQRPFQGDTPASLIHAILTRQPPDLQALADAHAPTALIDLVYRMLEKEPAARIVSVRQVGVELESILQGRADTPRTPRFASTPVQDGHTLEIEVGRFAAATPTPRTPVTPNNLPAQVTPLVGREDELAAAAALLESARLVTIFAPGGMGKTRLGLEVGARLLDRFPDGVFFVELAPLDGVAAIPVVIAEAVGVTLVANDPRPPEVQIGLILREKRLLLILDNFEHLIEGAPLVTALLNAIPGLRVVVTSRQRLNLSGETLLPLEGLRFPDQLTPEDARSYGAVQLFLQSARRARPDFELTTETVKAVVRICQTVGGMPLGLVLAASWLSVLNADEIADEAAHSIAFLESELSDLPPRQRSMRAVHDYSWKLLPDDERAVLMKLSLFRGAFSREAAQAVSGASLRLLMNLTNKSLLRRDPASGRYTVHELLRQFAEEKLNAAPADADAAQRAFSRFYSDITIKLGDYNGNTSANWLQEMRDDFENICIAWKLLAKHGDLARVDSMTEPINNFVRGMMPYEMGKALFALMRGLLPMPTSDDAPMHRAQRRLLSRFTENIDDLLRAKRLAERENDAEEIGYLMFNIAISVSMKGDYAQGLRLFDQAAAFIGTMPMAKIYLPLIHSYSSLCAAWLGDLDDARDRLDRSIAQMRSVPGLISWMSDSEGWIGYIMLVEAEMTGDFAPLQAHLNRVMQTQRELDYQPGLAMSTAIYGVLQTRLEDMTGALSSAATISALHRQYPDMFLTRQEAGLRGAIALYQGDYDEARRWTTMLRGETWMGEMPMLYAWTLALLDLIDGAPSAAQSLKEIVSLDLLSPTHFRQKFGDDALYAQAFLLMLAALKAQQGDYRAAAGIIGLFERGSQRASRHWGERVPLLAELPQRVRHELGTAGYQAALNSVTEADVWAMIAAL